MTKKLIVLKVYRDENKNNRIEYDGNGNVISPSHTIKLVHFPVKNDKAPKSQYHRYMASIKQLGFILGEVKVIKVLDWDKDSNSWKKEPTSTPKDVLDDLTKLKVGYKDLSAEEKWKFDMEIKMSKLLKEQSDKEEQLESALLESLRQTYTMMNNGKPPHHSKKVSHLQEMIKEKEQELKSK